MAEAGPSDNHMLEAPLAPYLLWAKTRRPAAIDLAGSNLLHCTLDDLPGAREALVLSARNDNGYAPLVEAIARHYGITSDRVATASGCSGANFLAIAALVGAGDHVLVERPTYDPLLGACRLMGADIERFDRRFEARYRIDIDDLTPRVTPRTRLIIVSTPHNPSGAVLTAEDLRALGGLADRTGAAVLVDEVYLDGASLVRGQHATAASAARLDGPFVITSSLTKSYGLAGLRSGWAISSPAIAERIRRTRDVVDNGAAAPPDGLAALAFDELPRLEERTRRLLGLNIERARRFFFAQSRLEIVEVPATSIVFPRIEGVTDTARFVKRLLDGHDVAVAPGRFFEAPAHFRVSLAGAPDALEAGLAAIGRALAAV